MNSKRQSKSLSVTARHRSDKAPTERGKAELSLCRDEKGFVLIAAIGLIAILALLGTVSVLTTATEIKISSNYKTNVKAFYAAQAGAEEARARLRGSSSNANYAGDTVIDDPLWVAYILTAAASWAPDLDDPDYDAAYTSLRYPALNNPDNTTKTDNSLQSDISYWVKVRHKREYDAEQDGHDVASTHYYDDDGDTSTHTAGDPGNIIYYGYGDPSKPTTAVQFATSTTTIYKPVEIITSYGINGGGSEIIKTEVISYPGPPIVSALYSREDTDIHGSSVFIDGTDNCVEGAASLPPIYLLDPAVLDDSGNPTYGGNPSAPQSGLIDIDIVEYINTLKDAATEIEIITEDQNGTPYGDSNTFVTCYSDTSDPFNNQGLKLSNVTGYGTLLVEGDLTLGGGFVWNGLILVTGELTFNGGGGGINILGAVLANQTTDVNGNVDLRYDSCMLDDALNTQSMKVTRWEDKKLN